MNVLIQTYQDLETAAGRLDNQDAEVRAEIRNVMNLIWGKLRHGERQELKRSTWPDDSPKRLSGTMADAEAWEAYAAELTTERQTFDEARFGAKNVVIINETLGSCIAAATRVAKRIRGET